MPYPKWPHFKAAFLDIPGRIAKFNPEGPVGRLSLKYVNSIRGKIAALGIDRLPTYPVAAKIASGELSRVLSSYLQNHADVARAFAVNRNLSPKTRAFVDFHGRSFQHNACRCKGCFRIPRASHRNARQQL